MSHASLLREVQLLGRRSLTEMWRTPEALVPSLFIPIFFLLVNVGQVSKTFPSSTPFLFGQTYAAFQLPLSLMFATSDGAAAGGMVEDILSGYFDKLRATPMSRTALVLGRLVSTFVRSFAVGLLLCLLSMTIGVRFASGPVGVLVILVEMSLWSVIFAGTMQLLALKTRSYAALNASQIIFFPVMFLTPNFVPRTLLARPMEVLAAFNPVTYLIESMRALILEGFQASVLLRAFSVLGVLVTIVVVANVRMINKSA